MALSTDALNEYADRYYLSDAPADLGLEERVQHAGLEQIVVALDGAERVLEMGYGTGFMTAQLQARGVGIELIEGSSVLCAQARSRHPALTVHEGLFEAFTPTEPYDAALALHVLEHVDEPTRLLERLRDWLVPGGALVVVVPNRESLHRQLAVRMGLQCRLDDLSPRDLMVGHKRVYGFDTLIHDLEQAGYEVESRFGHFLKTVPNSMMLDWPDALIDALCAISDELAPESLANIGVRARVPS